MPTKDSKPSFLANIIAGIGFFFLVLIIIWGLINVTRWAPTLFESIGSLFNGVSKTLVIQLESANVETGTPTTISWTHRANKGTYAFSYLCTENASLEVPTASGGFTILPCGSSYVITANGINAIRITPHSDVASVTIPISITYRDTNDIEGASGSDVITVTNTAPVPAPSPTPTPTPTPSPVGTPDLSTRLIGFGIMLNGIYSPTTHINRGDTVAIRFEIKNAGTKATGAWSFRALLPTNPSYTYDSVTQNSLNPGDYIEYTLKFTNPAQSGVINVTADPQNAIAELSETNNGISYQLTVLP